MAKVLDFRGTVRLFCIEDIVFWLCYWFIKSNFSQRYLGAMLLIPLNAICSLLYVFIFWNVLFIGWILLMLLIRLSIFFVFAADTAAIVYTWKNKSIQRQLFAVIIKKRWNFSNFMQTKISFFSYFIHLLVPFYLFHPFNKWFALTE